MTSADAQTGLSLSLAGPHCCVRSYTDEMEEASPSGDDPPHRRDWRDD
jgi:hypothetical protein